MKMARFKSSYSNMVGAVGNKNRKWREKTAYKENYIFMFVNSEIYNHEMKKKQRKQTSTKFAYRRLLARRMYKDNIPN